MKTKYLIYSMLLVMIAACDPNVDIPGVENTESYTTVYIPQAEGAVKNRVLIISEAPEVIVLGAVYGGLGYPAQDITVTFKVDAALVDAYNTNNATNYILLPEAAYTLSSTTAVIPSGKTNSSVLKLSVDTKAMTPFVEYMIAVRIEQVSGNVRINEELRTTYLVIRTQPDVEDYPKFDRANWTVVDKSSEEPTENNWGNGGLVLHTFDDNTGTFWHSQWNGGSPPPPHWFIIDMGATKALHGFYFLGRQSGNTSGRFKDVVVHTSINGTDWTDAGAFTLENDGDEQHAFLSTGFGKDARYFKITVNTLYEDVAYSHLAELHAF